MKKLMLAFAAIAFCAAAPALAQANLTKGKERLAEMRQNCTGKQFSKPDDEGAQYLDGIPDDQYAKMVNECRKLNGAKPAATEVADDDDANEQLPPKAQQVGFNDNRPGARGRQGNRLSPQDERQLEGLLARKAGQLLGRGGPNHRGYIGDKSAHMPLKAGCAERKVLDRHLKRWFVRVTCD